jgi:hypothetical protein
MKNCIDAGFEVTSEDIRKMLMKSGLYLGNLVKITRTCTNFRCANIAHFKITPSNVKQDDEILEIYTEIKFEELITMGFQRYLEYFNRHNVPITLIQLKLCWVRWCVTRGLSEETNPSEVIND